MESKINETGEALLSEDALKINESTCPALREAAASSKTAGIIAAVIMGIMFLFFSFSSFRYLGMGDKGSVLLILAIVLAVVGVIVYNMIQFGKNMQIALEGEDQELFEKGTHNLKVYMIILCVCVVLNLLKSLYAIFDHGNLF
ncbi:MAG: hypothetical protein ABIX01_10610 [Chitinophagaceae bacterium]